MIFKFGGNVCIDEPVEATDLDETLGHVEDLGGRVASLDLGSFVESILPRLSF